MNVENFIDSTKNAVAEQFRFRNKRVYVETEQHVRSVQKRRNKVRSLIQYIRIAQDPSTSHLIAHLPRARSRNCAQG